MRVVGADVVHRSFKGRRGLGSLAGRILDFLEADGDRFATEKTLAVALGRSKKTIRRHAQRLAAHKLVERADGGWKLAVDDVGAALARLEVQLGLAGATAAKAAEHEREREQRHRAQAAWRDDGRDEPGMPEGLIASDLSSDGAYVDNPAADGAYEPDEEAA